MGSELTVHTAAINASQAYGRNIVRQCLLCVEDCIAFTGSHLTMSERTHVTSKKQGWVGTMEKYQTGKVPALSANRLVGKP